MDAQSGVTSLEHEIVNQLLRQVSSCLLHVDSEGTIVTWSKETERMFGRSAKDALGKISVVDLFATRAEGEELLSNLRKTGRVETRADLANASGGMFLSKVVFSAGHRDGLYIGIVTDVSAEEQAQENYSYLRVYLDTLLEISGDAIITSDLDGVIMMFNEGAEAIFRREAFDALGEDIFELLFSQQDMPSVKEGLRESGNIRDRESKVVLPGGEELFLEITISKTRDSKGQETAMVALIRDTTTKKRLEDERISSERVQQEMRIARGVQLTMLPDRPPKIPEADIAARIEFCDDIGGDLFDFSHPRSGKLGVSIGDVSAHGVGPAIVMSSSKAMMNTLEQYTEDLEHMLFLLNNLLERTTEDDRFITMFYALIDLGSRTMDSQRPTISARRPRPLRVGRHAPSDHGRHLGGRGPGGQGFWKDPCLRDSQGNEGRAVPDRSGRVVPPSERALPRVACYRRPNGRALQVPLAREKWSVQRSWCFGDCLAQASRLALRSLD